MTDPERLLGGSGTELERALLTAADAEEPPARGAHQLAALIAGPGAAPPGGSGAGSGGGAAPSMAPAGAPLLAKWALVAAGAVAATGALVALVRHAPEPDAEAPVHTRSVMAAPSAHEEPAPPVEAPVSQEQEKGEKRETPPLTADRSAVAARPEVLRRHAENAARGGAPSIAGEIETLDRVRGLLAKGDARGALSELDHYRAASPRGALTQEAELLRIEGLARSGNAKAARGLAMRFLLKHPGTPHEKRVRALVGDLP
jgi:hypothetical protein